MKRHLLEGWIAVLGLAVLAGCGPRVSDTGYVGTWSRRGLSGQSTVAIVQVGDSYLFRWGRTSDDGRLKVRCDWDGACEESFDGEQIGAYRFRSWIDDEKERLRVECRGRVYDQENQATDLHYVDELVVRGEGTRLISRAVARDGQPLGERRQGKRIFKKISDSVVDPPKRMESGG